MTTTFLRILWLTGALLLSLIIGISGGVLDYLGGDHPAKAIIAGAAAFAATMTLTILTATFINPTGTQPARAAVTRRTRGGCRRHLDAYAHRPPISSAPPSLPPDDHRRLRLVTGFLPALAPGALRRHRRARHH